MHDLIRHPLAALLVATSLVATTAFAASPYVRLGPLDELALDQPRIAVELIDPTTGANLGPNLANTFLLDTGANSILIVDDAIYELNQNGYQTEGTFFEQGVGGFTEFDVSAKYDINFAGSDGVVYTIPNGRVLSSNTESFCPIPGLCSFFGIMGMPAMADRVTTLDLTTLLGDSTLSIDDIFAGNFNVGFLGTTFSDTLPATAARRYNIPLNAVSFPLEGDDALPSWSDLPFVEVVAGHDGKTAKGNFVLDTGAQLSILSSDTAFELGLDTNGNGTFDDEAIAFQDIGGVGGQIRAPVVLFEEVRLPTEEGVDIVYDNIQVAIVDIDPSIDGIFGMNFLSSGWSGSLFGDLGDLTDLLGEAGLDDLLGELGGLGLGGEEAPFGYYEKVHFDFRNWDSGKGRMVIDLMPEVSGIMAHDGTHGDLDNDGDVDFDDRTIWVHDELGTSFGDSNLDGTFDSRDLVGIFVSGEYEDDVAMNSTWATGDWNMDGEFTSKDLVVAFQDGGYVAAAKTAAVPEPGSLTLMLVFAFLSAAAPLRRK